TCAARHACIQGLWGKADNMAYLADQLAQRAAEEGVDMHILNSAVNEERLTYEGADVCGDRLVAAMEATAAELAEGGPPGAPPGWGVRLAVVLLLPLTLPLGLALFGYMVWVGRQQNAAVQGLQLDHSWLGRAPAGGHDPEVAEGRRGEGEGAHERAGPPALPPAQPPCRQPAALTPPDYEGGRRRTSWGGEEQQRAAQQQEPRPGDLDVLKPDGVKLHVSSGLVSTPGREQEAQRWMMAQLNSLAWTKVDVDVRHYDSHAAIMMRQPERFKDNADCIRYLVYRCFEM
ncbi:hypothetical protein QJQ45_015127, partial [Haematococcus lacustris]